MAATITILSDHKGVSRPSVSGDEYVVDAKVNITAYEAGGVTVNASDVGLSRVTCVSITGQEGLDYANI